MAEKKRDNYLCLRRRYEPKQIRLVLIAESPPVSGRYFYDAAGALSEPLFAALMRHLNFSPGTKEDGLREFQRIGWLLVDATYEPVNALTAAQRNQIVIRDYPQYPFCQGERGEAGALSQVNCVSWAGLSSAPKETVAGAGIKAPKTGRVVSAGSKKEEARPLCQAPPFPSFPRI